MSDSLTDFLQWACVGCFGFFAVASIVKAAANYIRDRRSGKQQEQTREWMRKQQ